MCRVRLPSPRSLPSTLIGAVDHARRWRPVVPAFVIDRALRRERGGVHPWHPDPARAAPTYSVRSIARTRAARERQQRLLDPAPRGLERTRVDLPHCTAERLLLPESRPGHVILYFHGGGYFWGSTDTHIGAISRFMRAARCEALSVDYRLAPEHEFPAWLDDALDAYRHLLDQGVDPRHLVVGGDSAGGGLTLALIQQIAEHGLPQPAGAFVISPWADFTVSGPSHTHNVDSEAMFGPGVLPHAAAWLVEQAGLATDHPLLSPAHGTYPPDAPPLRIDVAALELLRSDAELVAEAYARSGSHVDLVEHPTAPHAWTAIGGLRAARETAREIGAFIDGHVS